MTWKKTHDDLGNSLMMTMAQVALFGNLRSDGDNELKINKKR